MKTTDLRNYGISGRKVELSLMDCYEASHTLAQVESFKKTCVKETGVDQYDLPQLFNILEMFSCFLTKVALKPTEMPNIFLPEEETTEEKCY